jgi:hypothetical protein
MKALMQYPLPLNRSHAANDEGNPVCGYDGRTKPTEDEFLAGMPGTCNDCNTLLANDPEQTNVILDANGKAART